MGYTESRAQLSTQRIHTQLPSGFSGLWLLLVGAVSKLIEGEDLGLHSIHLCHALGRRASSGH